MANLQPTTVNGQLDVTGAITAANPLTNTAIPAGSILQVVYDGTNAVTRTNSKSGFQALIVSLTPRDANSKFIVMGNVYGSAGDDAHSWLEYRLGGGSWIRNTELNGSAGGGAAFADYAYHRARSENDVQTGYGTYVFWSPNTSQSIDVRVIVSAENTGGMFLNIGRTRDTAGSYNNTTTKSTLVVMEVAG